MRRLAKILLGLLILLAFLAGIQPVNYPAEAKTRKFHWRLKHKKKSIVHGKKIRKKRRAKKVQKEKVRELAKKKKAAKKPSSVYKLPN